MPVTSDKFNALNEMLEGREPEPEASFPEDEDLGSPRDDVSDLGEGYPGGMDPQTYKKAESLANDMLRMEEWLKELAKNGKKSAVLSKQLENLDWSYSEYTPQLEAVVKRAYADLKEKSFKAMKDSRSANEMVEKFLRAFRSAKKR